VGSAGALLHWNGSAWSLDPASGVATPNVLFNVWAASASSVWAVGQSGTIVTYNGSTWTPSISGCRSFLYGVWGTTATDLWAVGDTMATLRYVP
jgi:hypothetical protein